MEKRNFSKLQTLGILAIISLIGGFLLVLFGGAGVSPLYGDIQFGHNEFDANFFLYLGYAYINGQKPYIQIFDHKGLYIFWIEGLGALMGGRIGMYIIMSIYMSINIFCYILIFRELKFSKPLSYIYSFLIGLALMMFSAMGAHHSGELLNPFFSLMILFYVMAIERKEKKFFYLGSSLAGLAAGLSFISRPSEVSLPFAAVIFYFVYWLKYEKNLELLWNALLAIFFFIIPLSASFIEAISRGFFEEMLKCVFLQSSSYLYNHSDLSRTITRLLTAVLVLGSLLSLSFNKKKMKDEEFIFLVSLLSIDGLFQILVARYINYWISYLPIVLLSLILSYSPKNVDKKATTILSGVLSLEYVAAISLFVISAYVPNTPWKFLNDDLHTTTYINEECKANLDKIEEKDPNHEKEIYLMDANAAALVYMGRLSDCKYVSNSSWWSFDNPSINEYVLTYIQENKPFWIITSSEGYQTDNPLHDYVKENYKEIGKDYTYMYLELI